MSDKVSEIIGLYGGSFDPVHTGHVRVAKAFIKQFKPVKLIVMPCHIPPHKDKHECACDNLRLRMLRLAFARVYRAEVSDFEIQKGGVSYTVETLRELKNEYPDAKIMLVIGTDMYLTLKSWKCANEIFTLCEPCVYARGKMKRETRMCADELKRNFGVTTHYIRGRLVDVSSTELREKLALDKNVGRMLPKLVSAVIDNIGIYHSQEYRLETYRRTSQESVEEKRFNHILRVEQAAMRLAEHYGVDLFKARAAALLHDVTKRKTLEEQLNFAAEFGIIESQEFEKSPKVAHAFTAAGYAQYRLCVTDDDILNAIRYHTTGRANMSLLEKVVFLADGIEDGRNFDGVEELRKVAYEDIDRAMLISLHATREKINKSGAYLHPYTAEAIEYFEGIVK